MAQALKAVPWTEHPVPGWFVTTRVGDIETTVFTRKDPGRFFFEEWLASREVGMTEVLVCVVPVTLTEDELSQVGAVLDYDISHGK